MSISSDMPTRRPQRRRGTIKARRTAKLYLVDTGRGTNAALWEGTDLLDLGAPVTIELNVTMDAWSIVS